MAKNVKKDKPNKLKIGDTVVVNQPMVDWYCAHLAENYGITSGSHREIGMDSMADILFWTLAKITKVLPKGKVTGYGATDMDLKTGKELRRHYVRVVTKLPARFSKIIGIDLTYSAYYSESNLIRVKR